MKKEKIKRVLKILLLFVLLTVFFLVTVTTVAFASGLVDETINSSNLYSKYGLDNWQLDFYVDNSWGWLPWNWKDSVGKSVMYGLYMITNFLWTVSLYLSNGTGYIVQEAYKMDLVSSLSDTIGKNMQKIAGVSSTSGFSSDGLLPRSLLLIVFVLGIYVAYTGLIKRETSKAVSALTNFGLVFLLTVGLVAYAPSYISNVNELSKDFSTGALDIGTQLVFPDSEISESDSVDMIRDSLFSIQVQKPWLLLQYGTTSVSDISSDRVEELLSTSPDTNNGEDRENIVKTEINDRSNKNLTLTCVAKRLGMVFVLLLCNLGISFFVLMLCAFMIFSQILFIIYALFFVISLILSMIPGQQGLLKKSVLKLFNTIMTRAGITLIVTVAFSLSSMIYSLSENYPFLIICFLQIVVYAGIYVKMNDIMGMMSLGSEGQEMGRRMLRRPRMFMRRYGRMAERKLYRAVTGKNKRGGSVFSRGKGAKNEKADMSGNSIGVNRTSGEYAVSSDRHYSGNFGERKNTENVGKRLGNKIGKITDTPKKIADNAVQLKDDVKNLPTNAMYQVHKAKQNISDNVKGIGEGYSGTKHNLNTGRADKRTERQQTAQERQQEMRRAHDLRKLNVGNSSRTTTGATTKTATGTATGAAVNTATRTATGAAIGAATKTATGRQNERAVERQNKAQNGRRIDSRTDNKVAQNRSNTTSSVPNRVNERMSDKRLERNVNVNTSPMERMVAQSKEKPIVLNGKEVKQSANTKTFFEQEQKAEQKAVIQNNTTKTTEKGMKKGKGKKKG